LLSVLKKRDASARKKSWKKVLIFHQCSLRWNRLHQPSTEIMKSILTRTLLLLSFTLISQCAKAAIPAYDPPPGGWTYILNGDQAVCGAGAADSLDGTWNRSNGSSEWDCSAPGGTIASGNFPGGVMTVTNGSNPAETDTPNYLRIQDCGNPPGYSGLTNNGCGGCAIANPANRKILFVHDMTAEGCPDTVLED
jgi:hypothetical protein